MAELAIPILACGALYVMSNQNKESKKENFTNGGRKQSLPNTNVPNINYPMSSIEADNSPIDPTSKNYIKQYLNPHQTTDKFFLKDQVDLEDEPKIVIDSLSGNQIDRNNFKHNNMVPFFGAKITGPSIDSSTSGSLLDYSQGAGSQFNIKSEQAPLFNPQDNVQWTHGMPNRTDFIQSRQLPSTKIANVLPWDQEKVGPGIGLGYTTKGEAGFNSGMLDRDAWKPPTVDELRTRTNPKITFNLNGHEGPAVFGVPKPEQEGIVEKNKPNTDFALGPGRWFTTTGSSLGQTLKSEEIIPENNRATTNVQYYGATGNRSEAQASYMQGHYEPSTKPELRTNELNPVSAQGQGNATDGDFGIKSYNILKNNRGSNCQAQGGNVGGINGALRAMVAPIVDIIRPTRKENVIGNINQVGNITASVPMLPITNPSNPVKRTIKETTSDRIGLNYLNVSNVSVPEGAYQSTDVHIKDQQRNLCDSSTIGNVGGPANADGPMSVLAWQNQHNNVNKTYESRPNPGGTGLYSSNQSIQIAKREEDRVNIRAATGDIIIPPTNFNVDHVPSAYSLGRIEMPREENNQMNTDRMNPDILSAFKSNPYAQSLSSY